MLNNFCNKINVCLVTVGSYIIYIGVIFEDKVLINLILLFIHEQIEWGNIERYV